MRRLSALFAAAAAATALLAGASAVHAQDARVYVPTGDGGRYVKLLDPKTKVSGHSAAAVQSFRAQMGQVIAQMDGMAQVNTPPPGLCHQLGSWIEVGGALDAKVMSGRVEVMRPLEYRNGACIKTNNALVMIGLNHTSHLVDRNRAVLTTEAGESWYAPQVTRAQPGRTELTLGPYRVVALTRPGVPVFRPVSAERYAAEQVRQTEGQPGPQADYWRQTLPRVRGSGVAACLDGRELVLKLDLSGACRPGQAVMELNPAYYDLARPGDIQLVTVVTREQADNGSEPSRRAIWQALDFGRLAALTR